ncbi:MAG: glycosyltransferase [DPANN group archaeon]|nr:glycosyltransferase [DPANN group archaeon]
MKMLTFFQIDVEGGFKKRLITLLDTLEKSANQIYYVSTTKLNIKGQFYKLNENKLFHKFTYLRYFTLFSSMLIKSSLVIKKEDIDKIIVFGDVYGFLGAILKKIFDVPLVVLIRGDWLLESQIKKRNIAITKLIQKITFNSADKIITNSEDLKNKIITRYNIDSEKIDVVYNNIPEIHVGQKILNNHIGYVGTLDKLKNVDLLIRGFSKANIHKKLTIIGVGPEEEKLKKLVKTLNIENKVEFLGWRKDAINHINSFELLILPSQSEGCPNVILEALGCDTPCIGSGVGGIREVLNYDELLFEVNSARSITLRLEAVFKNYSKIQKLCLVRKKEFEFDWGNKILKIVE